MIRQVQERKDKADGCKPPTISRPDTSLARRGASGRVRVIALEIHVARGNKLSTLYIYEKGPESGSRLRIVRNVRQRRGSIFVFSQWLAPVGDDEL